MRTGAVPVDDPRGTKLGLSKRIAMELIPLLDDSRPAVRDQVVEQLASQGESAIGALSDVVRSTERSPLARRNAGWARCRMESKAALTSPSAGCKRQRRRRSPVSDPWRASNT